MQSLVPLIKTGKIKGLAHITGGGITDNVPRMLPDRLEPIIDFASWPRPDVFNWLQKTGNIEESEMRRAFNCGIGMVLAVSENEVDQLISDLEAAGESAFVIGSLKNA